MSGIDLWDDDLGADSATVEVPPLYIHLIAASEHEAFWRLGLEDHGVRLGDADAAECQLILVDERCPDYEQRLAQLPQRDGSARPPIFFLVSNGTEPDCMRAFSCGADHCRFGEGGEVTPAGMARLEGGGDHIENGCEQQQEAGDQLHA